MSSIPKYRKHPNGQAFVKVKAINQGRPYYLGRYDSPESKAKYRSVLKCIEAQIDVANVSAAAPVTIVELIVLYREHATEHYTRGGKVAKECVEMMHALRPLYELLGDLPASAFGPRRLREIQKYLIAKRLSRRVVNRRISRIRRFFRWASSEEHVKADVYHGLTAVEPLQRGQHGVREKATVQPVPIEVVEQTLPWMVPAAAAMVRIQLICGMRPSEVCIMRGCDIDRTGAIWIYRPHTHKNQWRDKDRTVAVPPSAQQVLKPFLARPAETYLFSPQETLANRNGNKAGARDHYDRNSYHQAVSYAIAKAARHDVSITHWYPLQLRHTRATQISQQIGEQAAQRWLGHERLETTGIYSAIQTKELLDVAGQLEPPLVADAISATAADVSCPQPPPQTPAENH